MAKKAKHAKNVPSGETTASGDEFDEAIAVLGKIKEAEKLDDSLLEELDAAVGKLSAEGQRRFSELPVIQQIVERAGEDSSGEPGTTKRIGPGDQPFSFKVPYSQEFLRRKWPPVDFIADQDYTIVTPGGWVFRLHEDVIYDTPAGEKVQDGHGYQLPNIVVGIINDSKATLRENRRETQRDAAFGMGVKYIGPGWAGKDNMGEPEGGEIVE